MIGSWMAIIAVRHLMGLPCTQTGVVVDAVSGRSQPLRLARRQDCPLHHPIERTIRVAVSPSDTLSKLRRHLEAGDEVMTWQPVYRKYDCTHCGFSQTGWWSSQPGPCPQCGHTTRGETTRNVSDAPDDLALTSLGIPSREILPVRRSGRFVFIELMAEDAKPFANARSDTTDPAGSKK